MIYKIVYNSNAEKWFLRTDYVVFKDSKTEIVVNLMQDTTGKDIFFRIWDVVFDFITEKQWVTSDPTTWVYAFLFTRTTTPDLNDRELLNVWEYQYQIVAKDTSDWSSEVLQTGEFRIQSKI